MITTTTDAFVDEAAHPLWSAPSAFRLAATAATTPPVRLTVGGMLIIEAGMPDALRRAIIRALTVENPAYREAEEHGHSTADLEPELHYAHGLPTGELVVPRGAGRLVRALCQEHDVPFRVVDATHCAPPVTFEERVRLSGAQERAVGEMLERRIGVLEAPAGAGKTVMAMALIARRQQPALIIVHTKELATQAIARAAAVLGLDQAEVGLVGDGECRIGERLTVALVQSLAKGVPLALLRVGHLLVDECHHTPAAQLSSVVSQIPAKYITGLSATVYRRDGLDRGDPLASGRNGGPHRPLGPGGPPHHAARREARHRATTMG